MYINLDFIEEWNNQHLPTIVHITQEGNWVKIETPNSDFYVGERQCRAKVHQEVPVGSIRLREAANTVSAVWKIIEKIRPICEPAQWHIQDVISNYVTYKNLISKEECDLYLGTPPDASYKAVCDKPITK